MMLGWPVQGDEIVYEFVDRADTVSAWVKVGDISINVILRDYRVYLDVRFSLGWAPGVVVVMWP